MRETWDYREAIRQEAIYPSIYARDQLRNLDTGHILDYTEPYTREPEKGTGNLETGKLEESS